MIWYVFSLAILVLFLNLVYYLIDYLLEWFIHNPPRIDIAKIYHRGKNISFELYTKYGDKIMCARIEPQEGFVATKDTKYLVFSHGNSSSYLSHIEHFMKLSEKLNVVIIVYDYIGYGFSENKRPTEKRCYESLECVMDYLFYDLNIDKKNIYLVGRSLGTGIVIDYVSKNLWSTPIILFSPYKSILSTKINSRFISFIDKFVSIKKIKNVKCPVKIFHGFNDTTVPISHGHEIFNALKNKSIDPSWYSEAKHCNIFDYVTIDDYQKVLNNKID